MRYLFYFIASLFCIKGYGQSKVIYIVPDSIEMVVKRHIPNANVKKVGFVLSKPETNVYSLSLILGANAKVFGDLFTNTNRVIQVDTVRYPVIFDYDYTFGSPEPEKIGEFGKREGNVLRSTLSFHGYTIYFNTRGHVIKESTY